VDICIGGGIMSNKSNNPLNSTHYATSFPFNIDNENELVIMTKICWLMLEHRRQDLMNGLEGEIDFWKDHPILNSAGPEIVKDDARRNLIAAESLYEKLSTYFEEKENDNQTGLKKVRKTIKKQQP